MWNISNQTIGMFDTFTTCGDWCKQQYYSFHTKEMLWFPILSVILLLVYKQLVENVKLQQHFPVKTLKVLIDGISTLLILLQIGFIIYLILFLS